MIYVDASAIVAIITNEPEADDLLARLAAADTLITSAIAIYEATLGILRKRRRDVPAALEQVRAFLDAAGITEVSITPQHAEVALAAFARYGKGQGHPAQLNMGDCFAYAAASTNGACLLFKGDDFARTDIRIAGV